MPIVSETIDRLVAYSEAGADVLYCPGVSGDDNVRAVVEAVAPKPVNVLLIDPNTRAGDLFDLGVKRVSAGGFLAAAAWSEFVSAASQFQNDGTLPNSSF